MDETEQEPESPIKKHDYVFYDNEKNGLSNPRIWLVTNARPGTRVVSIEPEAYASNWWCELRSANGWGSGAWASKLTLLCRPDPKYLPKE